MPQSLADFWRFHRRAILLGVALAAHTTTKATARDQPSRLPTAPSNHASTTPSSPASDVRSWDAIPAVRPAVSVPYPSIDAPADQDPSAYAEAFATKLFSRDYRASTRQQLIEWAQYEDSPLRSPNYPRADWSKVLVNSLTDLTWDDAADTPVPADGPWLALRSMSAVDTVSDVVAKLDEDWEQQIASGYQPPDPIATERDVTLVVTRHSVASGKATVTKYAVSIAVQLGTNSHGGYGVAATNNYVSQEMS
jgi:hypothetical protein